MKHQTIAHGGGKFLPAIPTTSPQVPRAVIPECLTAELSLGMPNTARGSCGSVRDRAGGRQ